MTNKIIELSELSERVLLGLRKAIRKLVEQSAANGENLIIGDKDGNIKSVPAKDILKTLSN
jgi:hypothetical protein